MVSSRISTVKVSEYLLCFFSALVNKQSIAVNNESPDTCFWSLQHQHQHKHATWSKHSDRSESSWIAMDYFSFFKCSLTLNEGFKKSIALTFKELTPFLCAVLHFQRLKCTINWKVFSWCGEACFIIISWQIEQIKHMQLIPTLEFASGNF